MKTSTLTAKEASEKLARHNSTISPGLPFRLTDAHTVGDGVWQGDLGIEIVSGNVPPRDYVLVKNPTEADRQLAIEAGVGSHHRLQSFDGVKLFRPADWGKNDADLRGPFIVFSKPNAIVHEPGHAKPHGTVVIDAPMTCLIRYQRNLTAEMRAVRARD